MRIEGISYVYGNFRGRFTGASEGIHNGFQEDFTEVTDGFHCVFFLENVDGFRGVSGVLRRRASGKFQRSFRGVLEGCYVCKIVLKIFHVTHSPIDAKFFDCL